LGPVAEAFITGAAAAGSTRLPYELGELATLRAAHGDEKFLEALSRAVAFGRWRAADVRSILATAGSAPDPRPAGDALVLDLPAAPTRSLAAYSLTSLTGHTAARDAAAEAAGTGDAAAAGAGQ
jgi:hypothetical protein